MKNSQNKNTGKEKNMIHHPASKKTNKPIREVFEITNEFFERKGHIFLWLSLTIMLLVSLLLFDIKVSDGGDDSAYIVRAYYFIHGFEFPGGFQGPLYPIVLSVFIKIMGINIPFLKFLSIIFMLSFSFLFHKSYVKYIPATLLYTVMLLISINSSLLYFASQTYSEAFFMMLQTSVFIIVFKYFISNEPEQINIKKDYKKFLILGLVLFFASTSKNIGYVSIIATLVYFLIVKHWKIFLYTILSISIYIFPFEIIKRIVWNSWEIQLEAQGTGLLYKDYYNPSKGSDGIWDFVQRFIDNSNLYISKHLYIFLGFKSQLTITPMLTLLTYGLFIVAFIYVFKKNKYLLFTGTYIGVMCAVTFVIVQAQWDQGRLIVIYYPYILLFIFGGFYYLLKKENLKKFQLGLLILLPVIFLTSLNATAPIVIAKKTILKKNLEGDILFGLTPDWINFIKMSQWAAENLPKDKIIASRKPDISFTYTERKFYGVFKVPTNTLDELIIKLNKDTLPVTVAVNLNDIQKTELYNNNRFYIKAFVPGGKESLKDSITNGFNYIVYSFSEKYSNDFLKQLKENNIQYHKNVPEFLKQLKKEKFNYMIYDPDMVLNTLKKNNVNYFILAKLRKTKAKSKQHIDTMDRLLYYVELKYPIFNEIKKIGTDEEARLLEAHYENLSGDKNMIKGLFSNREKNTPDMVNYIGICKWAAKNLPKNELIASIELGNTLKETGCKFYPVKVVTTITNEALTEKLSKDSLPVSVAVLLSDVYNNKNLGQFFHNHRFYSQAFVMGNKSITGQQAKSDFTYIIYSFSKKISPAIYKLFDEKKVRYNKNVSQLLNDLKTAKANFNIYDPDLLIKKVKKDNVKYFILGNIRLNPAQKGQTIQTMNYLLYFIELKYPIVREIHSIGKDENARILEMQYYALNKKLVRL